MLASSVLKFDTTREIASVVDVVTMQNREPGDAVAGNQYFKSKIEFEVVSRLGEWIQVRANDGRIQWLPESEVQIVFEHEPKIGIRIG